MFSYLHGIRPGNRRSAVPPTTAPPPATSSRYYHETSTYRLGFNSEFPPARSSQSFSNHEPSPVSPDPPILPPILRVTSGDNAYERDDEISGGREEGSISADVPERFRREARPVLSGLAPNNSNRPAGPVKEDPKWNIGELITPMLSTSPERPRPTTSRRKRPIDRAYEDMRAYSEPSRRQSLGSHNESSQSIQQPKFQPPLPPSKPFHSQPLAHSQHPPQPQRQAPRHPVRLSQPGPPATGHKSHGKTKLNLLNPMALLARRRSSQAVEQAYSQDQSAPGLRLPDDYDPRIWGKVVHDFSAPRLARPPSADEANVRATRQNREGSESSETNQKRPSSNQEDESPSTTERQHTPVFKENFDDNVEPWSEDMDSPAKRKSSAFMYQLSLQGSKTGPDPASLPAFARKLPSNLSNNIDAIRKNSTPPPKGSLEVLIEPPLPHQKSAKSSPPNSPPSTRSRATSINEPSFQTPGSPQRYKSNASRFSFDLVGVGSVAQEKLLEDKHRQHAKKKERESVLSDDNDMDDDDACADYDLDDEDGDFEERIPGVNADDDDLAMPALRQRTENLSFISPNKSSFESAASQVSTGLTSPGTPRDGQSHSAGFAVPKMSPILPQLQLQRSQPPKEDILRPKSTPGPSTDCNLQTQPLQPEAASETNLAGLPRRYDYEDDDMYFDDGMIDDFDEELQPFDESVFDDDTSRVYGLQLRDLKPLSEAQKPYQYGSSQDLSIRQDAQSVAAQLRQNIASSSPEALEDDHAGMAEMRDSITDLNQPARAASLNYPAGLTQDNLGLHDKLALAANQAALDGKFNRSYSQSSAHEPYDMNDPSRNLGLSVSQLEHINGLLNTGMGGDSADFAFDDAHIAFTEAEDDDPIIAAANAEALENDDDGFYGQEFGFFARASGSSESEYINGGYFGPRAIEGIHRMNSGRDNFQEPSLTPITERSEWSNRNSMISLAMHGYPLSAQYQSNPQLVDLMRVQEGEEMSMEALRKLRRGAWGGSNASLHSNSNSQNSGSPITYQPPGMINAPMMQAMDSNSSIVSPVTQNMGASFHSYASSNEFISSNDSDASLVVDDPTITLSSSQPGLMMQPMGPPPRPPPRPPTDTSPVKMSSTNTPWTPGHKRNSSGAESVSYREESGKWFIEKTRILEGTGEVEILERSVIEGGRI